MFSFAMRVVFSKKILKFKPWLNSKNTCLCERYQRNEEFGCIARNHNFTFLLCSKKRVETLLKKSSPYCNIQTSSSVSTESGSDPPLTILEKMVNTSPPCIRPFLKLARIERPTGTMLLLWPCYWSIALSSEAGHWPSLYYLTLFGLGAFLMRGAGCTINDMWDKELDSKVERTKDRPLASGEVQQSDALAFLAFELGLASLILLQLNWYCSILGASSLALVITYPLAKRFTNWPQLVLGFTFNWGALLGWAAIHGSCQWTLLIPLYLSGISWTLIYDTIYALQDKKDDSTIGIKSTALLFGDGTKKWLSCFSCSMVGNLLLVGQISGQTWPYYASIGLVGAHLAHQVITLKPDKNEDCAKKFRSNSKLGLILFLGLIGGTLYKEIEPNELKLCSN